MRKELNARGARRILAIMTAVMMCFTLVGGAALAQSADWAMLSVTLSWTTAEGNPMYATALPVTEATDGQQSFWVMVDPSASLEGLTLSLMHPNHPEYTFMPASGAVLSGVMDAGSTMDMTMAVPISAYSGDALVDSYMLYISTTAAAPVITPPEAAQVPVTVQYVLEDGTVLDSQTNNYDNGTYTFTPTSGMVGGYELVSEGAVTVNVIGGVADQPVVTFTYRAQKASITVQYVLEDGTVLDSQTNTYDNGAYTFTPTSGMVGGYELVSAGEVTVNVAGGAADQPVVTFTYRAQKASITVQYVLEDGMVLDSQTNAYDNGAYTFTPTSGMVGGYELVSTGEVTVNVAGGVADQPVVTFTYRLAQDTSTATVTINYYDENNQLLDSQQVTYPAGVQNVTPNSSVVAGYTITSAESQPVTIANGVAQPDTVIFTYQSPKQETIEAEISIYYQDKEGHEVATFQTIKLAPGTHMVEAKPTDLMAGYTPVGETSTPIYVNDAGVPDQNTVTFVYNLSETSTAAPQVNVAVNVFYRDAFGLDVAPMQTVTVTQVGSNPVNASPDGLPASYALNGDVTQYVNVDANGVADRTELVFLYDAVATPSPAPEATDVVETAAPAADAVITIAYTDAKGVQIADIETRSIAAGTVSVITPDQTRIPAGYTPLRADAVTVTVSAEGVADASTVTFIYQPVVQETPIPVGQLVQRWGVVNTAAVNWRDRTSTSGRQLGTFSKGTYVWVVQGENNDKGETWYKLLVNGQEGFVKAEFVDVLTQAESDLYTTQNLATPVPVYTSVPTEVPTAAPTDVPTTAPTDVPTTAPTDVPAVATATPVPSAYYGYAVTNQSVAIRTGTNTDDASFIQLLPADTLVQVSGQSYNNGVSWSYGVTLSQVAGMIPDASLTRINDADAQVYINAYNNAHATPTPSPSPQPTQRRGYAVAIGNNVYMRAYASSMSDIKYVLQAGDVAYVTGQEYVDGVAWHVVQYQSQWGYIRADLMRMMTAEEQSAYIQSLQTVSPTLVTTPQPYDETKLSSYGYVSAKSVNFRSSASTSSTRLATLKQYAFCLVLGTQQVNGATWYRVSYGGQTGYISGEYFTQLTISGLEDFLDSTEYKTGITNNTTSSNTTNKPSSNGSSGITSAEDQTVNEWTNPNSGLNVSYAPFDPYATAEPLATSTVGVETSQSPEPLETSTIEPLETMAVEYPTEEVQSGNGSAIGWVIAVIIVLLGGAGGAYAYILHKQNRRKAAARAAQRKAAIRNGAPETGVPANGKMQQRPGYAQPRTGTYQNKDGSAVPTSGTQSAAARKPYGTTGTPVNPYAPVKTGTATPANPYAPTKPAPVSTETPYAPTQTGTAADAASRAPYGTTARRSTLAREGDAHMPYDMTNAADDRPASTVDMPPTAVRPEKTDAADAMDVNATRTLRTGASSYGKHRRSDMHRKPETDAENPDFAPDDEEK